MGFFLWAQNYWFEIIQSAASGLEVFSRRKERLYQSVTNRITFTAHHRELWARYTSDPELHRVKHPGADISLLPVTLKEHQFVCDVIHHFADCFHAYKRGVFDMPDEITLDIQTFFSCPVPKTVWQASKRFQDRSFIKYVEDRF